MLWWLLPLVPYALAIPLSPDDTAPIWQVCSGVKCKDGFICAVNNLGPSCFAHCVPAGEITCNNVDCFGDQTCINEEVVCVTAPCYPVPQCIPLGNDNGDGYGVPSKPVICKRPPPDNYGVKPPPYQPAPPSPPSKPVYGGTPPGYPPGNSDGTVPTWKACAGVKCKQPGFVCAINIFGPNCIAHCIEGGDHTCDNVDCKPGESCVNQEVVCVRAPCYPVPVCIPMGKAPNDGSSPLPDTCQPYKSDSYPQPPCSPGNPVKPPSYGNTPPPRPPSYGTVTKPSSPPGTCTPPILPCPLGRICVMSPDGSKSCVEVPPDTTPSPPACYPPCKSGYHCTITVIGNVCIPGIACTPPLPPCAVGKVCTMTAAGTKSCVDIPGYTPPTTQPTVTTSPPPSCYPPCKSGYYCTITVIGNVCIPGIACTPPLPPCAVGKVCTMTADGKKSCVDIPGYTPPTTQPTVTPPPPPSCYPPCKSGYHCTITVVGNVCIPGEACTPPLLPCVVGRVCTMSAAGTKSCVDIPGFTLPTEATTEPTTPPTLTCANALCMVGYHCVETPTGPNCIEDHCGPNEYWNNCGNQCEGRCQDQCFIRPCLDICNPGACACQPNFWRHTKTGKCVPREECKECGGGDAYPTPPVSYVTGTPSEPTSTCKNVKCSAGFHCVDQPSGPSCVPDKCGQNEILDPCSNLCEGKCATASGNPPPCPKICIGPTCACAKNFYRNDRNQCVSKEECQTYVPGPPKKPNVCNILCIIGTHCVVTPSGPRCIPGDACTAPLPPCAFGLYCSMAADGSKTCVPPVSGSKTTTTPPPIKVCNILCIKGTHCVVTPSGPRCIPGEACTPPLPPCAYGLYCSMASDGSKTCVPPVSDSTTTTTPPPIKVCNILCIKGTHCVVTPSGPRCIPGEACTPPLPPCAVGLYCSMAPDGSKTCLPPVSGPTTTTTPPPIKVCNILCKKGSHCVVSPTGPVCIPGAACTPPFPPCAFGLYCTVLPNGTKTCLPPISGNTYKNSDGIPSTKNPPGINPCATVLCTAPSTCTVVDDQAQCITPMISENPYN